MAVIAPSTVLAQKSKKKPPVDADKIEQAEKKAAEALAKQDAEPAPEPKDTAPPASEDLSTTDLFSLWFMGGPIMIPITLMSGVVVLFAFERWFGLRRSKVIPKGLVKGLQLLADRPGGLDPRAAYQLCQQWPSTTASVLKSVLLKVGRPQSEIDHAFGEACEREAAKLYKNVRPLNLATTVTPLLGLLGTVQGMIECFYRTAHLAVGADKSETLADGIYLALLTTFGGLVVAIPASVFSHYFEGKIQTLFREIDELLLGLMPQLERFEGKLRMTRQSGESAATRASTLGANPTPVETPLVAKP